VAELEEKSKDPSAVAILFKKGRCSNITKIKVLRWLLKSKHVKIYKKEGYDWAKIQYYIGSNLKESVSFLTQ
jgi:hypothetical protein